MLSLLGTLARLSISLAAAGSLAGGTGCFRSTSDGGATGATDATRATTGARASDTQRTYPLDTLPTSTVTINAQTFRVWLARESASLPPGAEHTVIEEGLMHVPTSEIADDQGMLFVFDNERIRGFWMRNTIAPLDIAFARMNGTIVKIWQMPVLTLRTFSSIEPAMYALEVKQGTFERLGIKEGDRLEIPADVLTGR
ncbi:MAG: DUF192 domain-containing protein [Phycisphaerae bacterium]|nr:DUF192 domain-containing protein [Phycisphaerae bacterium]